MARPTSEAAAGPVEGQPLMDPPGGMGLLVRRRCFCEPLEKADPAAALADGVVYRLAADEPVEKSVFHLDCGPSGSVRGEPHLDLTGAQRIRVEPPFAVDLPCDDQPVRGLPGQHATPVALAAVNASLVPPSAFTRLQHGLSDVCLA